MNAVGRRVYEMVVRVLKFCTAQPDTDAGYNVSVARLTELAGRMDKSATNQRSGLLDSRSSSTEKRRLRREIRSGPIAHLASVGRLAAKELHELGVMFLFRPGASTYVAFRTAARSMQADALAHKEVLAKYGLSETVLEEFGRLLDQFDVALTLGNDGRTTHTGATQQLDALATEVLQVVRVMDARNRLRFQNDQELLGSWINASTVLGTKKAGSVATTPESGGEVRPAA